MQTDEKPYPIVDGLIEVFGGWLLHRRAMHEIDDLDQGTVDEIARDLRVSQAELDALVRQGPHSAEELPKLLKALGIDEAALLRSEPAVLRDMERVCAQCQRKAQCNNDIETGAVAADYTDYCLNASTLLALGKGAAPR